MRDALLLILIFFCCGVHSSLYPVEDLNSLPPALKKACLRVGVALSDPILVVDVDTQTLTLWKGKEPVRVYIISTASRGIGAENGSWKTPLGLHRICDKIGGKTPKYSIFQSRKYTGTTWKPSTKEVYHEELEDLILSRILRLEGLEEGINSGVNSAGRSVDSYARYIYIHGTNHEKALGAPSSQGCIRMHSDDVCHLFSEVVPGTLVWIQV